MNCAKAYGGQGAAGTPAGTAGANAAYKTGFVNAYGFGTTNPNYPTLYVANANSGPTSGGYAPLAGQTFSPHVSTSTPGMATIYVNAANNTTTGALVNTIAHEWSHTQGAVDPTPQNPNPNPNVNAQAIGNAVQAAYQKDKGSKCGGL